VNDELRARIETSIAALHGWTTVEKGVRLAELVIERRADLSVEIGVFGGRGTISMAIGHQVIQTGHVVAVDPWDVAASREGVNDPVNTEWWSAVDHEAIYEGFLRALAQCGVGARCRIVRERGDLASHLFADESVSVLHQDGNHSEKISTAEVEVWIPKLQSGGYWVADDTDWQTTRRAQVMLADRGFELVEDHGGWRIYRKP
jgi:hypothetical protein